MAAFGSSRLRTDLPIRITMIVFFIESGRKISPVYFMQVKVKVCGL